MSRNEKCDRAQTRTDSPCYPITLGTFKPGNLATLLRVVTGLEVFEVFRIATEHHCRPASE